MKNNFLLSLLMFLCVSKTVFTQNIGIGTNAPNASALLELNSNAKGLLVPRISLDSIKDLTTIVSPANALLVYNTNAAMPDGRGFYYYNTITNEWTRLATNNNLNNIDYWSHNGNAGTDPATDFIGTTDNKAMIFKTNGLLSGKIDPGPNNVFFGQKAGNVTTGVSNSFFGHTAGEVNTTGYYNTAVGNSSLSLNTTGYQNTAIGSFALDSNTSGINNVAVGLSALRSNEGGDENTAVGVRTLFSLRMFDGGNTAVGYEAGKDLIGLDNTLLGANAAAINANGSITTNSTAIGANALVTESNTMVFGPGSINRWAFGLTDVPAFRALQVGSNANNGNGAYLSGSGVWTNISDALKKEDFSRVDGKYLLKQITSLSITKWKYKGANDYHIGPTAQDFYTTFGLGLDDKSISTVDPSGIALAAIQEQQKMILKLQEELSALKKALLQTNISK